MALRLEDCSPALRARIEAALAKEPTKPQWAMATLLKGHWTIGVMTDDYVLIDKLVRAYNLSNPRHAFQTMQGKPPAVRVQLRKE